LRKEKEEEKKKETPEKGKRRGRKCGAEWLTARSRRATERSIPADTKFLPKRIFFITPSHRVFPKVAFGDLFLGKMSKK
jgi:hypothetical protein